MQTKDQIIEVYGPQLGELAWHSLHVDSRLDAMSEHHATSILRVVTDHDLRPDDRPIRILEVGAYAHHGAHRAAAALGGASVAHDVSPASLRIGLDGARAAGFGADATLVAGDFHDLPFETDYFDVVFCASSIHHTFRPWRVLRDMIRVLRPGGALRLENEPVGRALCFYGFRGNRTESRTAFESELERRGLMQTLSSPIPGSRSESLFGMIENDRIPLDMILDALTAEGEVASIRLLPQRADFEQRIMDLPRDADLEANLAAMLLDEIAAVRPGLTEHDRLLGIRLPGTDEIWRLSYQVAPYVRRLASLSGQEAAFESARLFGAELQATILKLGAGEPAARMFRRQLAVHGKVFDDLPVLPGVRLDLNAQSIPAIGSGDPASLRHVYPAGEWEPHLEDNGLRTMLNVGQRSRIVLPGLPSAAMLLLRFYAVAAEEPYRVGLRLRDGSEIASLLVVQSESLLLRELVPRGCAELFIETRAPNGEPVDRPGHVRLGVGRLIPVEGVAAD